MLLQVDTHERDDHALVVATGEIDAATADIAADAVRRALHAGHPLVVLSLEHITFIDSTGLGMLVKSHRTADALASRFAVSHPTPQTSKLIRVLGLDQLLHVYETTDLALAGQPVAEPRG